MWNRQPPAGAVETVVLFLAHGRILRLRYAAFARFSTQNSPVHRLDARIKLLLLLAFLVSLALLQNASAAQLSLCLVYLVIVVRLASLPLARIARISLAVVPFVGIFSFLIYLGGDVPRAIRILSKSYLSTLAVMICVASTPLQQLAAAAKFVYIPGFLVEVTQLIYRYLFVLSGEVQVMRVAFAARGGRPGRRAFESASGMVAVLFGRAFEKASTVHSAMLSRGFSGTLSHQKSRALGIHDFLLFSAGLLLIILVPFV